MQMIWKYECILKGSLDLAKIDFKYKLKTGWDINQCSMLYDVILAVVD